MARTGLANRAPRLVNAPLPRFLIPRFDGEILSQEWKEALWARFAMEAPRPRTPSELQ